MALKSVTKLQNDNLARKQRLPSAFCLLPSVLLCLCGLALSGCGSQTTEAKGQKPALIINELELSPGELKQELTTMAGTTGRGVHAGEEPEWLTRLIERELLVQEAQRLGLDRESDFMRTIERFWKEALIKSLISRKMRQISAQTQVYEPEIEAYYERFSQETQARVLSFADEASAQRAAQAQNLDVALAAIGPALLDDSGWQWYTAGMLDVPLETPAFDTPPGSVSAPIRHRGRWTVVAVAQRRARSVEPLAVLREDIQRTIRQREEAEAMEQWIAGLKEQARVVIDREAIASLHQ